MVRMEYDGIQYKIYFRYGPPKPQIIWPISPKRNVTCFIEVYSCSDACWVIMKHGQVSCDSRDRFTYEVGRKKALTKALASFLDSKYTKDFRTAVWKAYGEQTNKGWAKKEKP
jgi:hypothetical protein